jgi:hypothetical protein
VVIALPALARLAEAGIALPLPLSKDIPNPPNTIYATPRSNPAFDSVIYATPLD